MENNNESKGQSEVEILDRVASVVILGRCNVILRCHLGDSQMREEENQSNTNISSHGKRMGTGDRQSSLACYFTTCVTSCKRINLSEFQFALL